VGGGPVVGGGVPPAVQCETTNWLFEPSGVKFALAEVTLAPADVVMNQNEVFPL
jgi:hypothetical protein